MAAAPHRPAAITLLVLTPVLAELAWGSTPVTMAWLTLLWLPIYGAGVLLIRELWVRSGRGWPALVLLGTAYELVEDGIGLQALTSPNLYRAAEWGVRVLGFNVTYWEANAVYHVVFSVLVPITLVGLLFPGHRRLPYLRTPGTVVTAVGAVLGVGLLRLAVPPFMDPTYVAPLVVPITCALVAGLLSVVALRVLPRRPEPAPVAGAVPSPWVVGVAALVATVVLLWLLWPPHGQGRPAGTEGAWVLVPMGAGLALAVAGGLLVARRSGRAAWSGRHTAALLGGLLVAHTLVGIAFWASSTTDQVGLIVIAALTVVGLALVARRHDAAPVTVRGTTGAGR